MVTSFVYSSIASGLLSSPAAPGGPFSILGYQGKDIPEEYMVTITDEQPWLYSQGKIIRIRAPLQEKISTRTESEWSPLSAASAISSILPTQEIAQFTTGHSTVSRYTSRRIWTGGSTLDFTLNLKFEVQSNATLEVLKPLIELQRMNLPYSSNPSGVPALKTGSNMEFLSSLGGSAGALLKESFLYPPGPSPFGNLAKTGTGEKITVKLGKFMTIVNVVVKDIGIDVPVRMTQGGPPAGCIVTVHFQTYEMLTKETLDSIYANNARTTTNTGV